jgi:hypothetical protein
MKHIITLLALVALSMPAMAQEQETLFQGEVDHGGFGALVMKATPIKGDLGFMMGGYGGWLINHQFMIGGGGYGLVSNHRASTVAENLYSPAGERLYVQFGYGGLMLEYICRPTKLVHLNFQALLGAGGVGYRTDWYDDNYFEGHHGTYGRTEAVFVAEPAVNVELNITDWFRIHAGAGYRFVTGLDELIGLENSDLSGVSGNLALKFGAF